MPQTEKIDGATAETAEIQKRQHHGLTAATSHAGLLHCSNQSSVLGDLSVWPLLLAIGDQHTSRGDAGLPPGARGVLNLTGEENPSLVPFEADKLSFSHL